MNVRDKQYEWIRERLKRKGHISGTDGEAHKAFNDAFGGKDDGGWREHSPLLMRRLREMHKRCEIDRATMGIWAGYSGDPKWTVTYSLLKRSGDDK